MADSVSVADLVENARLDVYYGKEYLDERTISTSDISRPGLELTGFFLIIILQNEFNYLELLKSLTQKG